MPQPPNNSRRDVRAIHRRMLTLGKQLEQLNARLLALGPEVTERHPASMAVQAASSALVSASWVLEDVLRV